MIEEAIAVVHSIGLTLVKIIPVSVALAAAFTVLTFFWSCNPGRPWWRKRELLTDLCYWFFIPLFARYLRIGLLVLGAALLFGISTPQGLVEFYDNGHGPLADLPLGLQAVFFLVAASADFVASSESSFLTGVFFAFADKFLFGEGFGAGFLVGWAAGVGVGLGVAVGVTVGSSISLFTAAAGSLSSFSGGLLGAGVDSGDDSDFS